MINVTVTLDEATLEWVRVKAARNDKRASRMLGQLVDQARIREGAYESAMRAALAFTSLQWPPDAKYLNREEAHERAGFH